MTRWWNEAVGWAADRVGGGVPMLVFWSLLATVAVCLGWYFWPRWLPWRWPWHRLAWPWRWSFAAWRPGGPGTRRRFRLGALKWRWRLRWRRKRRDRGEPEQASQRPPDELPDLPAAALVLTADQLAAAGRYREAVRERLRAIIRDLVDRGVIPISPGWTVIELATFAINARAPLAPALRAAVDVFSEIWYGLRPAQAEDDQAMRSHAGAVGQLLARGVASGDRELSGSGSAR